MAETNQERLRRELAELRTKEGKAKARELQERFGDTEFLMDIAPLLGYTGPIDPSIARFQGTPGLRRHLTISGYNVPEGDTPMKGPRYRYEDNTGVYRSGRFPAERGTVNAVGANATPQVWAHEYRHQRGEEGSRYSFQTPAKWKSEMNNRFVDAAMAQTPAQWKSAVSMIRDGLYQFEGRKMTEGEAEKYLLDRFAELSPKQEFIDREYKKGIKPYSEGFFKDLFTPEDKQYGAQREKTQQYHKRMKELGYNAGGTVNTTTTPSIGQESSLSNWAGPYVTNMLGMGQAVATSPYQAYQGPLTAGAAPLQQQAFSGIAGLALPTELRQAGQTAGQISQQAGNLNYTPSTFEGGIFGAPQAQQYMNPYLQASLEPQLLEARRQAGISRLADASRLTEAGAYGGSRQAIMESEGDRNLQTRLSDITGRGFSDAYNRAMDQFNSDQTRRLEASRMGEQSSQFEANYGLDALKNRLSAAALQAEVGTSMTDSELRRLAALGDMGGIQRGIEGEGIAADYAQFQQERDYPQRQLGFMQSLLQGLPLEAQSTYYAQPSTLSSILGGSSGGAELGGILSGIFDMFRGSGGSGGSGSEQAGLDFLREIGAIS